MKYFAMRLAYNGAAFSGFAPQKHATALPSVSDTLRLTLARLGIDSPIIGAGRTDKGVHSLGMIVRFCAMDFWTKERLYPLLAQKLYPHITLRNVWEVDSSFHPRFNAKARRYMYLFAPHIPLPFYTPFIARQKVCDIHALQECLQLCIGTHNFALFAKSGSNPAHTIRTIYATSVLTRHIYNTPIHIVRICGNAFLRSQVRLLLGSAFAVANGTITQADFLRQLHTQKRIYAIPAPAQGLYFDKAWYA